MFSLEDLGFIRRDSEPERVEALKKLLEPLLQCHSYTGLVKGDRLIMVHETCVAHGAGTPNLTWCGIITATEIVITRDNPKTYSYQYVSGYREEAGGKLIKAYTDVWYERSLDGWYDNRKCYIIPNEFSLREEGIE